MSGILRLESLTKGNTLKQGDKTPLKYRLFDADGEKLNVAGKSATVRLVYPDFMTIGYEKDGLTVAQDDTVTFTIDQAIPARIYHVEIIVDGQFIFPSRADEAKFTIDKSSLDIEANIIEIIGVDQIVNKVLGRVDADIGQAITDITTTNEAIQQWFEESKPRLDQTVTNSEHALTKVDGIYNTLQDIGIEAQGLNLLDDIAIQEGYFVHDATGAEVAEPTQNTIEVESINKSRQYTLMTEGLTFRNVRIVFKDMSGNYIKGVWVNGGASFTEHTFTTPEQESILYISYDNRYEDVSKWSLEIVPIDFKVASTKYVDDKFNGIEVGDFELGANDVDTINIKNSAVTNNKLSDYYNSKDQIYNSGNLNDYTTEGLWFKPSGRNPSHTPTEIIGYNVVLSVSVFSHSSLGTFVMQTLNPLGDERIKYARSFKLGDVPPAFKNITVNSIERTLTDAERYIREEPPTELTNQMASVKDIEIIGADPETPLKIWMICRDFTTWHDRILIARKQNGQWQNYLDSGISFEVQENEVGYTPVEFVSNGVTFRAKIDYSAIPSGGRLLQGSTVDLEPFYIIPQKNVRLTEIGTGGGGGEAYDQQLNTFNNVEFNSVKTNTLDVSGTIPTGTLSSPPSGLLQGDMWADTTDSATHPIVRVML